MPQQIVLKNLQKPVRSDVWEDLNWLSDSFGFSFGRDTESITAKILKDAVREISRIGFTSTECISDNLSLSVQRVNYHLKTLIDAGFLLREKRRLIIRHGSVKSAVEEMRKDANRIFDNLSLIAEEIDADLGLKNR